MTKEEWKQAEEALTHFFHPVELKVDGYDITLILERVSVYQNKIMVYIGGEFRGQWMAEDCEVRRRFLQEQRHNILSGKQRAEFERLPPVEMQSEASQEQKEVKPMRNASKRMGKKGTLTIPQHLRHELGLDGGTAVDLTPTGDGGLVIQKHRPTCNICQGCCPSAIGGARTAG